VFISYVIPCVNKILIYLVPFSEPGTDVAEEASPENGEIVLDAILRLYCRPAPQ